MIFLKDMKSHMSLAYFYNKPVAK